MKFHKWPPIFLVLWFAVGTIVSCGGKDSYIDIVSKDRTKPDPIKTFTVFNFNGGAHIVYDLPKVDNILAVRADYYLGDDTTKREQVVSSYFRDSITVEGFAEAQEYTVRLSVISRANIESDPIYVKVHPDTPAYKMVRNYLQLAPDFAGVRITANNHANKNIGIVFLNPANGRYSVRQITFSAQSNLSFPIRGYDTVSQVFGAYVTDKWRNVSDTLFAEIKPLYEREVNHLDVDGRGLIEDIGILNNSYRQENAVDGNLGNTYISPDRVGDKMPIWGTFYFNKKSIKLSRVHIIQRRGHAWSNVSSKRMTIWGNAKVGVPEPTLLPLESQVGDVVGDGWVNMGNILFPTPPSGASYSAPAASDKAWYDAGQSFDLSFSSPKVRWVRIMTAETWTGATVQGFNELTFFGDDR